MFLALNIFSNRNINFVVMSIMFVCVACSDLNSYGDDKSVNNLKSENKRNPTLVFGDTVENNSSKNSSVKTILSGSDSGYTITSTLCDDNEGPSCAELPLGDDYLTTSVPAQGYLYSCTGKNPNAPGSIENKITWIDFSNKTWDFLRKLWLPRGTFNPGIGTYEEIISGDKRQIKLNNLPVDGKIGNWPMTAYPILTEIDRNPGIPTLNSSLFTFPVNPTESSYPTCVSLGPIGVTKNGVVIYNAADARGEDAVAREIVDEFGGHPAGTNYHYHFIPERLDDESLTDGHSGIVGYINDGFPIYGYKGEGGVEMSNDDLDLCHGHNHGKLGYHYHATVEYPYTVGCYKGYSVLSSSIPALQQGLRATPATQVQEPSATPTRQAQEPSATPTRQAQEPSATPTRQAQEPSATSTRQVQEPSVTPTRQVEGASLALPSEIKQISLSGTLGELNKGDKVESNKDVVEANNKNDRDIKIVEKTIPDISNSQEMLIESPLTATKPKDKYICNMNSDGYCIFSGTPHNSVLSPNTKNIVNRNGEFLFYINEAVAVDSSGEILKAKGTPAFDGDDLIAYSQKGMTDDEKAFHKVMAIMFPIRNALMYDIAELNESDWNELVTELRLNGIKDKTYTGGPTPKDNYYGREGIFNLAKNPNGRNIHHDVMKFLEESGIYLLCHFTSNDFNQMLKDTHPENHNPCEEARAGSDLEDEPSKIDSSLDSVKSQLGNEFLRNVWMCDESPILVDDYTTGNNDSHRCKVTIEFTREDVVIRTKGIPNHDFESMTGCCAREQDKVYKIPINPIEDIDGKYTDVPLRGTIAFTVTGVAIYGPEDGPGGDTVALDNGYYVETRQQIDLGLCGGHSGPGGEYHYHWDANCIHWHSEGGQQVKSNGSVLQTLWEGYSIDKIDNIKHSPVIGFAFDGYPIYGTFGWDSNGRVKEMKSSYFLKTGRDGSGGVSDWSYSEKLGHLDECNGHFGKTPDFDKGVYHYHSTLKNGLGDLGFPYFLGCYHGEVNSFNLNNNAGQQGSPPDRQQGSPPGGQQCEQPEGEQLSSPEIRKCLPPGGQQGPPSGGQQGPPSGGQQGPPPGGQQGPPPGGQQGPPPGGQQGPPSGGQQGPPSGGQQGPPPGGQQGPPPGGQQGPPPDRQQGPPPDGQQGPPPGGQQGPPPGGQQGPPPGGQQGPPPGGQQGPPPGGQQGPPPGGQQGPPPGGQQGPPPGGQQGGFNMGGGMQQGGFNMGGGTQQGGFNMGGGMQQGGFNMGGGMQQGGFRNLPNPFP